jgi:hypothetical protein
VLEPFRRPLAGLGGRSKAVSEALRTVARAWASDKAELEDDRGRARSAPWGLGGPRGAKHRTSPDQLRPCALTVPAESVAIIALLAEARGSPRKALQARKWTDRDGQENHTTEIVLSQYRGELTMLDGARSGGEPPSDAAEGSPRASANTPADFDENIPF